MLMTLICSVSWNESRLAHDASGCRIAGGEAGLPVSPLAVAGIVIGLVLFLSCVTIIMGSFRKDSHLRNPNLRSNYDPDGFSDGGSVRELRSTCAEDGSPAYDLNTHVETQSQFNVIFLDSPPRYEECTRAEGTQIYVPTDDPPPYSLADSCQRRDAHTSVETEDSCSMSTGSGCLQTPASMFLTLPPPEDAPAYEAVAGVRGLPIPLIPTDHLKHCSHRPISHGNQFTRTSLLPGIQL